MFEYIGTDVSNHFELGEAAIEFLETSKDQFQHVIDNLPPDERAVTKAQIGNAKETYERLRSEFAHVHKGTASEWPLNNVDWK